ncbi:MAG TPA: hypothetical protein H9884_09650 [Candidatus Yaniella excrementigallinarum]|nr:hypothetical protein [Candidatus Yaniella excrementigallinarum]
MTTSAVLLRTSALIIAAGLGLTACSSDEPSQPETTDTELSGPPAPETTPEETALAETLESDFEVKAVETLHDQWPDIVAMSSALSNTDEPDQCQEAGASQYNLILDAEPANVQASFTDDALVDQQATGETLTVFYANDQASADQLQQVHEDTDTACITEDDSEVDHEESSDEIDNQSVEIHTWQIVVSGQLTGRVVDVVGEDIYVRYASSYPPQVMIDEVDDDVADFNEEATARAVTAFEEAAAAQ